MRILTRSSLAAIVSILLLSSSVSRASADESNGKADRSASKSAAPTQKSGTKADASIPEINLLEAQRQGLVSVTAEGRGDGRMTVSVTNRTRRPLRVVLPPGIIAQG